MSDVRWFEPLLLRDEDIQEIFGREERRTPTELLAAIESATRVESWLVGAFRAAGRDSDGNDLAPENRPAIACLATYYPDITSHVEPRRIVAIDALINTVLMAIRLKKLHGLSEIVMVEAVCGAVVDACSCDVCRAAARCYCSTPRDKVVLLLQSLREVVQRVKKDEPDIPFCVCLELEPGESYVLNAFDRIDAVFSVVDRDAILKEHIGLNADITHMMGCSPPVTAQQLVRWRHRIAHSHVCDQPSMHTIDQPLGSWTAVCQMESNYVPYFRLLATREATDGEVPFSGCVSVELESNDRWEFVYRSVAAVRHLAGMVAARG